MDKQIMRVGVVGCGIISDIYLKNMQSMFDNLEVVACSDIIPEKVKQRAEKYGIRGCTTEELLADSTIEMVVVLTPAPTHYAVIKAALEAGKHVYTEKTMTCDTIQAHELIVLANEKGLYLGAAPDTFMGAAFQRGKQIIESGEIGTVTSFQVCANRNLDSLTSYYRFLRMPGGGICYDYGVYYLTALVHLLGSISEVAAVVENRKPVRIDINPESPEYGKPFAYENEGQVTALLRTEDGVTGSFTLNGESIGKDLTVFAIYGTKGVLKLANPNGFGGELRLLKVDEAGFRDEPVENTLPYTENCRGLGPSEMADAIFAGRRNQANKEQAYHVLDVISAMMQSSREKTFVEVNSRCIE